MNTNAKMIYLISLILFEIVTKKVKLMQEAQVMSFSGDFNVNNFSLWPTLES